MLTPQKMLKWSETEVEFTLTQTDLTNIKKDASMLQLLNVSLSNLLVVIS